MIGQVAIAIAFPGFNDLGSSVTPVFLFDGTFSPPIFYVEQTNEENLSTRSFNFLQNTPSSSFFLAARLSVRRFQMALVGLRFVKLLATFGFMYATDPLLQNMTKIVCLR